MIKQISMFLALKTSKALGEKDNTNIYCYGFQIILNSIISIMSIVMIGILVGKPVQSLFYLVSYCTIRLWAGGYHASSNERCISLFIGYFLCCIVVSGLIEIDKQVIWLILILGNILIILLAPVGTKDNPIPISSIKAMKRKAIISSLLVSSLVIIQEDKEKMMYALFGFIGVVLLMVFGKINKEEIL